MAFTNSINIYQTKTVYKNFKGVSAIWPYVVFLGPV